MAQQASAIVTMNANKKDDDFFQTMVMTIPRRKNRIELVAIVPFTTVSPVTPRCCDYLLCYLRQSSFHYKGEGSW